MESITFIRLAKESAAQLACRMRSDYYGILNGEPRSMQNRQNLVHVAIRLQVGNLLLRAASLAPDECENVKNGGNTANVSGNTHESVFHIGMPVGEYLDMVAHISQPVNFHQQILENSGGCRTISR
jgi:hypothetical protein